MRRVIREVITLIRIERWLVLGEEADAPADGEAGQVVEQLVLSAAEAAQARELFRHIIERRQWEVAHGSDERDSGGGEPISPPARQLHRGGQGGGSDCGDAQDHHEQGEAHA